MAGKRGAHYGYSGPVADSPEIHAENEMLEAFGLSGSTTLPPEVFTGPVDKDDAELLLARARPLGGVSIGKDLYGPRMRLLSGSLYVPPAAGNPERW